MDNGGGLRRCGRPLIKGIDNIHFQFYQLLRRARWKALPPANMGAEAVLFRRSKPARVWLVLSRAAADVSLSARAEKS